MRLPKTYNPADYESDIYALWEKSGTFTPKDTGDNDYYSIVVPPPNANANLHIGFGLVMALEDIAVRYNRLKGKSALLIPGADHAGFETQVVYEKRLAKEGKSRFDFSREVLYQRIWDFVAKNRKAFETQFRRLGGGVDWSRFTFTLDEKIVKLAYATFKKMWEEGLIYRGERLVNYCTFHGTAFADIEVEYEEKSGHLYYIRYPLTSGGGELVVATTRPETMLGDTAVAVHPNDKKLAKFVGKTVKLPMTNREIPIIADAMVDMEFGTGAVKITPAHDQNDFEVAERHDLPRISVIDYEGKISSEAPEAYRGLDIEEARKQVVVDLEEQGFLVKTEVHKHSVGHCYKCHTVIQPLLREQWFVDMKPLATEAIKALKADKITFYPASKKEQLIKYLEGLKDWNISRQIAWGIPIPAFQNINDSDDWIYDERVGEELIKVDGKTYKRDADVFDTWFSSSSWPYATLDFPDGKDFKRFYPLSLMETGGEILYPWVSRMIMMGLYVTGEIPFKAVYIHGYVMAEDGAKMSKSIGNVIDPMEVIDKYGSDALRMGIVAGRVPAVNRGYDHRKVEDARNFANKLWNIARYTEGVLGDDFKLAEAAPSTIADYWILTKLQHLTEAVSATLDEYQFAEAYDELYHFVWDDFADWYIEASKLAPNNQVLARVLEATLIVLHPFAPFVTETIWQTLKWEDGSILAVRSWPKITAEVGVKEAQEFADIQSLVGEVRYLINELNLKKPSLHSEPSELIHGNAELIRKLASLGDITETAVENGVRLVNSPVESWLAVSQSDLEDYKNHLKIRQKEQASVVSKLETRLKNKAYVSNAPKSIIEETKHQLNEAKEQLAKFSENEKRISAAN
ncbi:MAG TPA: valine--tRNA ligase [Candidatus Saccharimonadales bacterium]|nr:valine--tRNA ligase [Candidatus Saccharimonadales bacterium]